MNHRFPIGLMVLVAIPGIAIPGRAAPGPWVPTGGPAGGIVENVTTEGDMALASTRSSVFRSTDRGETWTADVSGIPEGVVIEALGTNGSVGLAGTRASGLFRSADGGRRWVSVPELPSTIGAIHFEDAAVHVLAHSDFTSSIFRSSDTGDTWSSIPDPPDPLTTIVATDDIILGASAFAAGLLRTTDAGATWERISGGLPFGLFDQLAASDGVLFAGSPNVGVYRSVDNGDTWEPANSGLELEGTLSGLEAEAGNILVSFFGSGIYRSTDLGSSWHGVEGLDRDIHEWIRCLDGSDAGTFVTGLHGHGVFRSDDGGAHWDAANTGLVATSLSSVANDGTSVVVSVGPRVVATSNMGVEWSEDLLTRDPASVVWSLTDIEPQTFLAGTQDGGILRTTDAGDSWRTANGGYPRYNGTAGLQYREAEHMDASGNVAYVGTGFGTEMINGMFVSTGAGVYRSTSGGITWTEANVGLPSIGRNNYGVTIYPPVVGLGSNGPGVLVGLIGDGIFRSTDHGLSWDDASTGLPTSIFGNRPDMVSFTQNTFGIFAAAQSFPLSPQPIGRGVFRSLDLGRSWEKTSAGLPEGVPINDVVASGDALFAAASNLFASAPEDGVYRSTNGGRGWQPFGLAGLPVSHLHFDGPWLMAGVRSRGIWRRRLDSPPTKEPLVGR